MGDNRVSVKISVTGSDGKTKEIDWWLNWTENMPSKVFDGVVKLGKKAQLPTNPFYEETDT